MELRRIASFPDPVNEKAARTVAAGVVLMCLGFLVTGCGWLLAPLLYGFWARVIAGPKLSPLAQLATRIIAPHLGPAKAVPGPPKRFAQGMGAAFATTATILWLGPRWHSAALIVIGLLAGAALLESALAFCVGCAIFGWLMGLGLIPGSVCAQCADLSKRQSARAHA